MVHFGSSVCCVSEQNEKSKINCGKSSNIIFWLKNFELSECLVQINRIYIFCSYMQSLAEILESFN